MCERTCPDCGSTAHTEQYGVIGTYIVCDGCGLLLANRRDGQAAPLDRDPDEWAREGTFIRPGAEAANPADDVIFQAGQ